MPEDEKEEVNVFLNYEKIKWNESEIEKLEHRLKEVENRAWDTWTHQIEGKIEVLEKQLDNEGTSWIEVFRRAIFDKEGVNQFRNIEKQLSELKQEIEQMKIHIISPKPKVNRLMINQIKSVLREDVAQGFNLILNRDHQISQNNNSFFGDGIFQQKLAKCKNNIYRKLPGETLVSRTLNRNSEKSGQLKTETDSKLSEEPQYYCEDCDQYLTGEQYMLHNKDHWIVKGKEKYLEEQK